MLADQQQMNVTFPIYFGNVCLRFIPVFDIVVHRYENNILNNIVSRLINVL